MRWVLIFVGLAGCTFGESLGDLSGFGAGGSVAPDASVDAQAGANADGSIDTGVGAGGAGGGGGPDATVCPDPPTCNWCNGTEIIDDNNCVVGFLCANGDDPCTVPPCKSPGDCAEARACRVDGLCWSVEFDCEYRRGMCLPEGQNCPGTTPSSNDDCAVGMTCCRAPNPCEKSEGICIPAQQPVCPFAYVPHGDQSLCATNSLICCLPE